MSLLPILTWPDTGLRAASMPVRAPSAVARLAGDMFETMYAAPGRGLAAPQVGVRSRLFVMDATWKDGEKTPMVCINPVVEPLDGPEEAGEEACLSMPGVSVMVTRPTRIRLRYTDLDDKTHEVVLTGAAARIAQHETDHLDGVMHFQHLPLAERGALLTEYEALR
ncbi:peptide deformylase [Sagittula sp.]|uniref:peptide deformylase n=1 Tax=Sagittula sp. TaxID=2038081 RepID=UPI003513F95E